MPLPLVALICLPGLVLLLSLISDLGDPGGRIFFTDFAVFWGAGRAAYEGHAPEIYSAPWFSEYIAQLLGRPISPGLVWRNPPTFLLVLVPISLLPFAAAWLAWIALTAGALVYVVHRTSPGWQMAALALLAPASVFCALLGQNSFLTATLATLMMRWLDRRPIAAGVCIGLLTYKPQFGIVIPLLLLVSRRWSTLVAAGLVAAAMIVLTSIAFGQGIWSAFLVSLLESAETLSGPQNNVALRHHSIAAMLQWAGTPAVLAWGLHVTVAGLAAGLALRAWMPGNDRTEEMRAVATFAAMMLATPYVIVYDYVLLVVAVAHLVQLAGREGGWLAAEAPMLAIVLLLPASALVTRAPLAGSAAWLILLACVIRRQRRHPVPA